MQRRLVQLSNQITAFNADFEKIVGKMERNHVNMGLNPETAIMFFDELFTDNRKIWMKENDGLFEAFSISFWSNVNRIVKMTPEELRKMLWEAKFNG